VKSTSEIQSIKSAKISPVKVIVGSGTNQERILLGWNDEINAPDANLRCLSI
jgi:polar amino acid transport system substrate-binding protein